MSKTHYVFICGEINQEMNQRIGKRLLKIALEAEYGDQLAVIIKSDGGVAGMAYEIIYAMQNLEMPIITVGHRTVGSAATIILASGQTRLITTNTNIVHHHIKLKCNVIEGFYSLKQLVDIAVTLLTEVKKMANEQEKIWRMVTRDSRLTPTKIKKMLKKSKGKDLYFNDQQAKKLGLAHKIIPNIRALPAFLKKR